MAAAKPHLFAGKKAPRAATVAGEESLERVVRLPAKGPEKKSSWSAYTSFSETVSRAQHFLARKAQGWTDAEAADDVLKVLFDYSKKGLTQFEQKAQNVILFYSWTRRVLPALLRGFRDNPSKMALLTRATTQPTIKRGDVALPEFVRESSAIPIGETPEGALQYLTGVGSPLEELQKFDPTTPIGSGVGSAAQIGRKILTQLNPLLRYPMELALQQDAFLADDLLDLNKVPTGVRALGPVAWWAATQEQELPGGGETRSR